MRRVFRWLGLGLLFLLISLTLTLGLRQALQAGSQHQVIAGLVDSGLEAQTVQTGAFRLRWHPERGGFLEVVHAAAPDHVLWSSQPGLSFVGAAQGTLHVEEARGSFFVDDQQSVTCARQQIDQILQAAEQVVISGVLACSDGGSTAYTLTWEAISDTQLQWALDFADPTLNRSFLTYASSSDEHFFGFGEQFSQFDLKGHRVPILVSEQGVGRGAQPITGGANIQARAGGSPYTSYAAVPHYISSHMRSLFLLNDQYSVFDLRAPSYVQIKVAAPRMVGQVLYGATPAELIEAYTAVTGRMRALPDWILEGAVIGMQGGTAKVRTVWQQLQAADTPIAAFWLQDWVGQRTTSFGKQLWWNWELDRERYPNWDELVADLHAADVRVLTYVNPFFADVSDKPNHRRNLFQEARDAGYLVMTPEGTPYLIQNTSFDAGLLDLSNPAARDWMQAVLTTEVLGAGADGWMADFGEALPFDARLASGESAADYHNRYPVEWASLNADAIDAAGVGEDAVFFMRAGYRESPRYSTLFWLGDQMVAWDAHDGIKTAVTGLLSSGMSGYSLNHSDIGGYTTITSPIADYHRSAELLKRWSELNAFTTIYRTHEGNQPENNVQFYDNADTLEHFSRFAHVYAAWSDYRRELVAEAAASGLPVVRHPFIHYPDDPRVYELNYQQFMVGSEFMVAPVLDPGVAEVEVYLPAGRWVHVWSGATYGDNDGERITIAAPIGEPAVFYREGSVQGAQFVQNLHTRGVK